MDDSQVLSIVPSTFPSLDLVGPVADQVAIAHALEEYQQGLSSETTRRQKADLALFTRFLEDEVKTVAGDFYGDLNAWCHITFGIVEGFKRWQLLQGYATGSINVGLATIKAYCKLAFDAGIITIETYTRIQGVRGYKRDQARNVDEKREKTRLSTKKAVAVPISPTHMRLLKAPSAHALGARDALLMCLLLDHGLPVCQVARLAVAQIDLQAATLIFYRHKVNKPQVHNLTPDTLSAAQRYLATLPPGQVSLFDLVAHSINERVRVLGERCGLMGLSPHDCRHAWATDAARNETDVLSLQQAGGWSSIAMPARYVEQSKIANQGVKLTSTKAKM